MDCHKIRLWIYILFVCNVWANVQDATISSPGKSSEAVPQTSPGTATTNLTTLNTTISTQGSTTPKSNVSTTASSSAKVFNETTTEAATTTKARTTTPSTTTPTISTTSTTVTTTIKPTTTRLAPTPTTLSALTTNTKPISTTTVPAKVFNETTTEAATTTKARTTTPSTTTPTISTTSTTVTTATKPTTTPLAPKPATLSALTTATKPISTTTVPACPDLNNTRTQTSNWHFDTQAVGHNTNVTLTCSAGYWWQPPSLSGHPNTTKTVNCGSDGNWTPTLKDCVPINKDKTKTRIVFDAAAKFEDVSLNDKTHQGPKQQRDLFDVLLRLRKHPVAVVCDIAEMYLRIGIDHEDKPYHRFLWKGMYHNCCPDIYKFDRVVFGVNSSPFQAEYVLQQRARENLSAFPLAAENHSLTNSTRERFHPERDIKIGEVVLIITPETTRGNWPLRRILEDYPGQDGRVRVVKIQVGSSKMTRSVTKLCPLELNN
ncbi:uncharacterized protein DDB_G0290587-like [Dreissena polymorpha]|uniref:uncharacterized protein DDB_G0290587-like n=1 Tax=Dreissena polymorpha TaxID=45954 RepID=UPI0022647027|nr:uncharacterized protein DDB_G0290587-like [Dreissena polymorpha]